MTGITKMLAAVDPRDTYTSARGAAIPKLSVKCVDRLIEARARASASKDSIRPLACLYAAHSGKTKAASVGLCKGQQKNGID